MNFDEMSHNIHTYIYIYIYIYTVCMYICIRAVNI